MVDSSDLHLVATHALEQARQDNAPIAIMLADQGRTYYILPAANAVDDPGQVMMMVTPADTYRSVRAALRARHKPNQDQLKRAGLMMRHLARYFPEPLQMYRMTDSDQFSVMDAKPRIAQDVRYQLVCEIDKNGKVTRSR